MPVPPSRRDRNARIRRRVTVSFGLAPPLRETGFTTNVSARGLGISSNMVHPPGTKLLIELRLAGGLVSRVTGVVAWSQRGSRTLNLASLMGIRVLEADDFFRAYVDSAWRDPTATVVGGPGSTGQPPPPAGTTVAPPRPPPGTTGVPPRPPPSPSVAAGVAVGLTGGAAATNAPPKAPPHVFSRFSPTGVVVPPPPPIVPAPPSNAAVPSPPFPNRAPVSPVSSSPLSPVNLERPPDMPDAVGRLPRFQRKLPMWFGIAGNFTHEATTENVSKTGLAIKARAAARKGAKLSLRIRTPLDHEAEVKAEVVWAVQGGGEIPSRLGLHVIEGDKAWALLVESLEKGPKKADGER